MIFLKAFAVGGLISVIGQILIDFTKLTPARILTMFVVIGVVLGSLGIYEPLVKFAGCGASVPISGFGYVLSKGVAEAIKENGFLGVLCGPLSSCAAGIGAAVIFGWLTAVIFKPKIKG